MEPAAHGRDDETQAKFAQVKLDAPQWSPPLTGGTTEAVGVGAEYPFAPQWSPPLTGGTTSATRPRTSGS